MVLSMNQDVPSAEEVAGMTNPERKVLENRLRRAADRQGLALEKSRLRDTRAIGFGTFRLVDQQTGELALADESPRGFGVGLHDVARYLYGADDGR